MADHSVVLDETIQTMINNSFELTKALENRIAEAILAAGGQPDRQTIVGIYRQYAQAARGTVGDITRVSQDTIENQTAQGLGSGATPEDTGVVDLLVQDAGGTIEETVAAHGESITNIVITGALTGIAVDAIAQQARGAISGVYMESSDPQIRRLQAELRALELDPTADPAVKAELRKRLREGLPVDTSGSLSSSLAGAAESAVMRFDGAFTANRAKRQGITRYRYEGGVADNTRPWCAGLAGEELDEETILDMWSESWAGKSGDNPWVDRGGYNCRHYWVPIEDEE